jgi:hypothetical protein
LSQCIRKGHECQTWTAVNDLLNGDRMTCLCGDIGHRSQSCEDGEACYEAGGEISNYDNRGVVIQITFSM